MFDDQRQVGRLDCGPTQLQREKNLDRRLQNHIRGVEHHQREVRMRSAVHGKTKRLQPVE
ncbi:hypothetical protein [Pararobbsia alpina]|uniref:hypothetical protein n=1 Tax=Pararobbsia alpina TaxID=621374 RepID=UPI001583A8C8|nr:hypothetical protein [Pararobbsia alpina]